jgi:hypothetical protein
LHLPVVGASGDLPVWGAAGGTAAGAGGYEWKINQEMKRIEESRESGKMSQEEYQIRKDQIERMSILK